MIGKLIRPLTYRECIERGCTEDEAIDYLKGAGPPKIVWELQVEDVKPLQSAVAKVEAFVRSVRLAPYSPGYLTAEQFSLLGPALVMNQTGPGWFFEEDIRIVHCDVDGFSYVARREPP